MVDALAHKFRSRGLSHTQIRWQRPIAPPEGWRAPTMLRLRVVAAAAFGRCALLVVISNVGRAVS
jgi:hypothetical protein